MVLQFWRLNTTMGTSPTGFRSFDEAAPLEMLDDARRQALFGNAPTPHSTDAPAPAAPVTEQADARRVVPVWDATGIEALSLDIAGGSLTVGCTESRELALAIRLGAEVNEITIGSRPAPDNGRQGDTAFALFDGGARAQLVSGASNRLATGGRPRRPARPSVRSPDWRLLIYVCIVPSVSLYFLRPGL
ncbi:hypothetical protein [Paracoccus sp. R86501]|uniref:hypothetical protein n=1 Tax=Paracoccus sp. R86501 TaxID=3101711 RepID=UPI00367291CC